MKWQATDIPAGQSDGVKITKRVITWDDYRAQIMSFQHHPVPPGTTLTRLIVDGNLMMVDTDWERRMAADFVNAARGDVLIFGLGLGCTVREIIDIPEVSSITVVEKHPGVIALVAPFTKHPKLTIVHGDAFTYQPAQKFDAIWIDIWPAATADFTSQRRSLAGRYRRWKKPGGFLRTWRIHSSNL